MLTVRLQASRHVKVLPPSSPYFSVQRHQASPHSDEGSKVSPGLEVAYTIRFRPDHAGDYRYDLVVATERERFLVPVICHGPAAALDFPDVFAFPSSPAKCEAKQSLLVTNVGTKEGGFALSATHPFAVLPAQGRLAPGETLQCTLTCVAPVVGPFEGELEILYDTGKTSYMKLTGTGHEMEVGLQEPLVTFIPTYVTKYSQKGFRIVNNGTQSVRFSCRQHANVDSDVDTSAAALDQIATLEATASRSGFGGSSGGGLGGDDSSSDDEATILNNSHAAQTRRFKRLRRDVALDAQLFSHPNFTVFPPEGNIWPGSEAEVIVQFQPTQSILYNATIFVDVEGRVERLPLSLSAQGLGPLCVFMDEGLDIGDAYVNTLHEYVIMLQNRGQIDAEFELVPQGRGTGGRPDSAGGDDFASKFVFSPQSGKLTPNQIATIKVQLYSDTMGSFSETFMWGIRGKDRPLPFNIKGRVSAPSFKLDTDELNYGLTSYGFK